MEPIIAVINLLSYFKFKFIKRISLVLVFSIFTSLIETFFVISTVPLLNFILSSQQDSEVINNLKSISSNGFNFELGFFSASIFFILFIFFASIIRIINIYLVNSTSAKVGTELCRDLFIRILNKPYIFFSKNDSSAYMTMITQFAPGSIEAIQNLMDLIRSFLLVFGLIIALCWVDGKIAINSLFLLGLAYLIIIYLTKKYININSQKRVLSMAKSYKVLQESFGGIREIILSNKQYSYTNAFTKDDSQVKRINSINSYYTSFPRYLLEGIGLSILVIVTLISRQNTIGSTELISKIGALGIGVQRLLPSIQQFYSSLTTIRAESGNVKNVIQFLKDDDLLNKEKNRSLDKGWDNQKLFFNKTIQLRNISFAYDNENFILEEINFTIKKGEKIGIIGSTGSGKSTLIDIIMGLLEPSSGEVKIDEITVNKKNINPIITKKWQKQISHVPQDIYLSNTTIIKNIANFSNSETIDKEKAIKSAKLASIHNYISSLKKGYSQEVGERGLKLSGGQKQRIGIARSFYKECPLLILDEATSALDESTEAKIMNDLYLNFPNLTVIVIAHRKNTLINCDKILEIEGKTIKRVLKSSDL